MSIAEMQACLARLYTDDTFRGLFYLNEDSLLGKYILTDDEQIAIKTVDRKMLDFFAASLKNKRKKKFSNAYQAFFSLDSKVVNLCYERYHQLYPARPNLPHRAEILQFGQFIEETLAGIDTLPPYTSELVRYERMIALMDFTSVEAKDDNDHSEEKREVLLSDKPALREGVNVQTFVYDVAAIHQAFLSNEEPQEGIQGQYYILFLKSTLGASRFFSISRGTKVLLEMCDGSTTLGDIVNVLQARYDNDSMGNLILAIANHMLELGVIEVRVHEEHCSISS